VERSWGVLLALAAILAACDPATAPAPTPTLPSDAGLGPRQPTSQLSCPYPSVRPTYLPWLKSGEAVPPPRVYQYAEADDPNVASLLDWRSPLDQGTTSPYYVTLTRQSDPNLSAPGVSIRVTVEGSDPGELYEGIEPGEAAIYWVIPNVTSCSTIELSMVAPDMTRERALKEIVKIAESLRPAD
jgi:hypothetical protein